MILLLFFLAGVTLTFYLLPDWPLAAALLVPMGVVLVGRLVLFWSRGKEK